MSISRSVAAAVSIAAVAWVGLRAQAAPPVRPAALERVAFIGASCTDGFLLPIETDAMITLADVFAAGCAPPIDAPIRRSSALFFTDPDRYGRAFVDAALQAKPTLVIGVDFLFWFGYGAVLPESARMKLLERGLKLLEAFDCPVIVGDFPDMHAALKGKGITGGPIIHPIQVPDVATLDQLNARLRAWAKERGNVTVVPLADFVTKLRANRAFEVRGAKFEAGAIHRLIDADLLHTTLEGTAALTLVIQDAIVTALKDVPADAFLWDTALVKRRVLDAKHDEIEARTKTAKRRAAQS